MKKNTKSYEQGLDERLGEPDYAAEYLSAAAEEGKDELLLALRDVARATGVAKVAKHAHRGRESLYKSLSHGGNPGLDTLLSVLNAVHLKLHFEPTKP
jgi:probable addiction module antidote protein